MSVSLPSPPTTKTAPAPSVSTPTELQSALVVFSAALLVIQLAVTVATYRISRRINPFVMFLSEMLINSYSLTTDLALNVERLFSFELSANARVEWEFATLLTYTSVAINLLVAVNRGCSIMLPVYYEQLWTRRAILRAVLATWVLSSALRVYTYFGDFDGDYGFMPNATFLVIYTQLQYWTTYPSLAVYALALVWVVLNRQIYHEKILRLRVFVYCFLSFLPNCYFIFFRTLTGFYFSLFVICRLAMNGCLLLAMSSLVRQNLPGRHHLSCLFKWWNKSRGRLNHYPLDVDNISPVTVTIAIFDPQRLPVGVSVYNNYYTASVDAGRCEGEAWNVNARMDATSEDEF